MKIHFILILALALLSCDHGLEPPQPVQPGFGGTIYFDRSSWPSADSLVNLWVFASQIYPLDSATVFTGLFSNPPSIYVYPGFGNNLPLFVDSVQYAFDLPPGTYKYVGIIQHYNSDINVRSLRVVGVYGTNDAPPIPIPVIVNESDFIPGIDMRVNFRKPPPQPF